MGAQYTRMAAMKQTALQATAIRLPHTKLIKVSGSILDPDAVKKEDIIGAVDPSTGAETGAQIIRQVYPRLGVVPGLIIAPGWSQIPEVGLALIAKAALINGVFRSMALVDLDTTKAKKYTDTKKVKEDSGYTSPHCYPLWPCDRAGEYILAKSAVVGAAVEYIDAGNDDVPNLSPSNHLLGVTGQCLADGTPTFENRSSVIGETVSAFTGEKAAASSNNNQAGGQQFVFSPTYHFESGTPKKSQWLI